MGLRDRVWGLVFRLVRYIIYVYEGCQDIFLVSTYKVSIVVPFWFNQFHVKDPKKVTPKKELQWGLCVILINPCIKPRRQTVALGLHPLALKSPFSVWLGIDRNYMFSLLEPTIW